MTTIEQNLSRKLNPNRFPGMSPRMAAIVGCILDQEFTEPTIAELIVTSDGCVLGRRAGDIGYNDFFGARSDLEHNWEQLLDLAGLSEEERQLAERSYSNHIAQF